MTIDRSLLKYAIVIAGSIIIAAILPYAGASRWLIALALAASAAVGAWAAARYDARLRQPQRYACLKVLMPPARARARGSNSQSENALGERIFRLMPGMPWRLGFEVMGQPDRPAQMKIWAPQEAVPHVQSAIESVLPGVVAAAVDDGPECHGGWMGVVQFAWSSWWAPIDLPSIAANAMTDAHCRITSARMVQTTLAVERMRIRPHARITRLMRAARRARTGDQRIAAMARRIERLIDAPFLRVSMWTVVAGDDRDGVQQETERIARAMTYAFQHETFLASQRLRVLRLRTLPAATWRRDPPRIMDGALLLAATGALIAGACAAIMREPLAACAAWSSWGALTGMLAALIAGERHPAVTWRNMEQRRMTHAPFPMSAAEIGQLWTDPPEDAHHVERTPNLRLPAPHIAFEHDGRSDWIALATARRTNGEWAPVGVTLRDLRQILHVTAGMGAGKSRLLANIVKQIVDRGYGVCVIDGKGDDKGALAWLTLDLVPLERERDIVWIDPLEQRWPVALNPLQTSSDSQEIASQLLAMMSRLDASGWSKAHGMEQLAMHAGILVAESEPRPTLAHVKRALLDESYRTSLLGRVRNPETRAFWRDVYPGGEKAMRTSRDALVRRIDKVLAPDVVRWLFTSPAPSVRFGELMESRAIVVAPMPVEQLGGIAYAVAVLLVRDLVSAAFRRAGSDMERENWPLIVDEVQVLLDQTGANDDFRTMLTRMRSLGIPALYAHQSLSQLGTALDVMLVNAANRAILRTPPPDAEVYARRYAHYGVAAADIASQPANEHQYLDLVCSGSPTGIFSARPLPWPASTLPVFEPWTGEAWSDVRAPAPASLTMQRLDAMVERLMDLQQSMPLDVVQHCEHWARTLGEQEWNDIQARWFEHRMAQRDFLLRAPQAIPDHRQRRIIVSSLRYGRPAVAAMIDYWRLNGDARRGAAPLVVCDMNETIAVSS